MLCRIHYSCCAEYSTLAVQGTLLLLCRVLNHCCAGYFVLAVQGILLLLCRVLYSCCAGYLTIAVHGTLSLLCRVFYSCCARYFTLAVQGTLLLLYRVLLHLMCRVCRVRRVCTYNWLVCIVVWYTTTNHWDILDHQLYVLCWVILCVNNTIQSIHHS